MNNPHGIDIDIASSVIYVWYIIICVLYFRFFLSSPVRIFLNASSTFVESKADVSMNAKLFFSVERKTKQSEKLW